MARNKHNTPGIIKYPFWQMTMQNPRAVYVCLNLKEAVVPQEIAGQSICILGDIEEVLAEVCYGNVPSSTQNVPNNI